ncbi:MAG: hypothetical protein GXO79_04655 [Chlorobi bacterium]|nr:hypothetical protein [Chlorobiota bacterium]
MKNLIFFLFVFFSYNSAFSQKFVNDRLIPNSVYAELSYAGKIKAATINYERYIGHSDYITFYAKGAVGYWQLNNSVDATSAENGYMFPISIQTLLFNSRSHIELGFGINTVYENLLKAISVYPIVNVGYRIQSLSGGLVLRFNIYLSNGPFPGVSVGYSF